MGVFFFFLFATLAVGLAVTMVVVRNPVHSALALMGCFVQVAALFVLLRSPFLAVVQVFVYVGAIMVLFLFVIMILDIRNVKLQRFLHGGKWSVLGLVTVLGAVMVGALLGSERLGHLSPGAATLSGSSAEIGVALFGDFLLPFEVVSVILLVALVGAILMARKAQ